MDPKQLVADGYDQVAERHLAWSRQVRVDERTRYTTLILDALPEGASVLELGCGAGSLTTQRLAERFQLTGVDISPRHVQIAQRQVPGAGFIQGDMTALEIPPASVDGVVAFYSIIHVPREEHAGLFRSIAGWLRPGGLLFAALGVRDTEGTVEEDWLGAPMYFSHYDGATSKQLVAAAGLEIVSAQEETAEEDGSPVTFLWVVARKPE